MSQDRTGDGLRGEGWALRARPGPRGFTDTQVHREGAGRAKLLGVRAELKPGMGGRLGL